MLYLLSTSFVSVLSFHQGLAQNLCIRLPSKKWQGVCVCVCAWVYFCACLLVCVFERVSVGVCVCVCVCAVCVNDTSVCMTE